jgi:tripartite-type tricarboxylate transporter receptor subunit TctC
MRWQKVAPDGHTLLLMDVATLAINPALFPRMPFDVQKDLAPVSMIIYAPYLSRSRTRYRCRMPPAWPPISRRKAVGLNMANSGVGSMTHLTSVEILAHLGIEGTQVPYRGGAPALMAVAAGEADMIINGATATQPYLVNGQMKGIGVSGEKRLPALPDVPTFKELGWPMADAGTWQGIMVQGNTPRPLVERLYKELRDILGQPAMVTRLTDLGGEPRPEGPDAFRSWLTQATEITAPSSASTTSGLSKSDLLY